MLQLPADLCFLDESTDQVGILPVCFEQDLDGQIAPQVRVTAFQHNPHPAASDLAQKLDTSTPFYWFWHLGRRRVHHGRLGGAIGRLGKENRPEWPDCDGKRLKYPASMRRDKRV